MSYRHKPVLLDEVIEALNIRADGFYIDGTFGQGGHSRKILKRLGPQGHLLAFDKDPEALRSVTGDLIQDDRFNIIQGSFAMLRQFVRQHEANARLAGVLFDLGVCSSQLDNAERGFSFRFDAPLDMRMDPNSGESVADWLNKANETEIANVIYEYGEERASRKIANAIVDMRSEKPIVTTMQLAELVRKVIRHRSRKTGSIHPATKTFQALRIFINHELEDIKAVLPQVIDVLQPNGRLVVISFHSLEDRIVKRFIRDASTTASVPGDLLFAPDQKRVTLKQIWKKVRATAKEINDNPRARSAILRVAERCTS